jgi:hypothetical protein
MNHYNKNIVADIHFQIRWGGVDAIHTEEYEAFHVNFWRDCLPKGLYDKLGSKSVGQTVRVDFSPGSIVPEYDLKKTFEIKKMQFNRRFAPNKEIQPRMGRFYPKGLLNGVAGFFLKIFSPFAASALRMAR